MTDEIKPEEDPTATVNTSLLDPVKFRRKPDIEGIDLKSLGQTWKLANLGLARAINEFRNSIYDDRTVYQDVSLRDIRGAAWVMLVVNYNLTPEQLARVIDGADQTELVEAVIEAAFVDDYPQSEQNYTNWARSSLIANGIDPAKVDKADIPHVLRQLIQTGRAIPLSKFTAADEHAAFRAEMLRTV